MLKRLLLIIFIIPAMLLYAGTTGKIVGTVTDQETGEALPGINIILEGTTLGAATDPDGNFLINNIPPGFYNVIISGVGFQKKKYTNVKVTVDFTTRLDVTLSTEVITVETIVVQAEAPLVKKDLTSSHTSVDASQIESLPVESISQILSLQAGIIQGTGGELHIRGGRSTEIAYTVNGVSISNPYNNSRSVNIATNAIQELSVVSGTFNAEYGNALSGIVNTVTKEGGEKLKGSYSFYTGDYISNRGDVFNNIGDIEPFNNYVHEMTLGGPIPGLSQYLKFFVSGRYDWDGGYLYGIRQHNTTDSMTKNIFDPTDITLSMTGDGETVAMNTGNSISTTGKLTFNPISTIKINYDVIYSSSDYKSYSHLLKYNPDASLTGHEWGLVNSLELRQALDHTTFYSAQVSYNIDDFSQYLYPLLDNAGNPVDFHAGMNLDPNIYHADPRYQPSNKLDRPTSYSFYTGGTQNGQFYQRTYSFGGKFDITSQLNKNHEVKFGAYYKSHELNYESFTVLRDTLIYLTPTIPDKSNANRNSYTKTPVEFSTYIQDKMEFDNLIMNIGIRYDYFSAASRYSTDIFNPTPNDPTLPTNIDKNSLLADAEAKHQISPRVGISFPITDRGIIHFSYGHFFQMPPFQYLYSNPDFKYSFSTPLYGNADLKPEKTVTYEIGLQQQLSDNVAFNVTGYYKDVRDLLATQQIRLSTSETYLKYVNKDYGNIRGIIFSFTKRRTPQDMLGVSLDYTFQVAEGNDTDPTAFFLDINSGRQSEKVPIYLAWDQSHTLNGTVSVGEPGDWNATLVARLGTGLPYDPLLFDKQVYLRPNSGRKPSQARVDLLAEKTFDIQGYNVTMFLKVFNLFDTLIENVVYSSTGRSTYTLDESLEAAKSTDELAARVPGVKTTAEYFNQPQFYRAPREVRIGLSLDF